ncbi:MAG: 1-acyl-sn-glycerol-3-phosphate acyltransferase [Pirellulaceae bacterium]|nr:1-acyl-sn-glycerol-3-phosphate acyltransferase [Pirellulaceae bacterium]
MNRQPYCRPPQWWPPKLSPAWVRWSRAARWRRLRQGQRLTAIEPRNIEVVRDEVRRGHGVLITPNHSAHYDSAALYVAADRIEQPLYFMTAWQVFAMSGRFERWAMQRLGCFSVDRESNDRQAFKQAVQILQEAPHPLVIFPEGDIYHTSDCVTPFREGAAAIGLAAAKRAERPLVAIPCGIKFWYTDDPTGGLCDVAAEIEQRLYLRSQPELPLPTRIHRLAEAALALKELDYLGHTRAGLLRERVLFLTSAVLQQLEARHRLAPSNGTTPERVKALRQVVIRDLEQAESPDQGGSHDLRSLQADMEDLFFVMQLFSYRGDYLANEPSVERLAETLDKFEEDVLGRDLPTVHGRRRVCLDFGAPIPIDGQAKGRDRTVELTRTLQTAVQQLIDAMNERESPLAPRQ